MDTIKLKWRLSKLPTVDELLKLVNDKVITQEEAREILFNKETDEERDKESLKSEIKFLRDIIENLSKNNTTKVVEIIKEYKPIWSNYTWYTPYTTWGNGIQITPYSAGTQTISYKTTGLSVNAASSIGCTKFSDIKTF